jgi:hypothetical protein
MWDATPVLTQPAARAEFLAFAADHRIGTAWIQVDAAQGGRLADRDHWQTLLADAHRTGLAVHALDGSPDYVLPARHGDALNIVNAVIAFNRESPADAHFDGVHFDNEPYLLPGWHDPARREQLMRGLLDLSAAAQRSISMAGGMQFGVDIPFWWQSSNAETGESIGVAEFNGQRKAASYHLLDLVDNVGIMDYRNVASGRDGLIAHATELLTYANGTKARVFVGVETSRGTTESYWFLTGVSRANFRRALTRSTVFDRRGFTIIDDGDRVAIGMRSTGSEADEQRLAAIARELDATPLTSAGRREHDSARRALAEDGEWRDLSPLPIVDGHAAAYGGWRASRVMLSKLTFAGRDNEVMTRELDSAEAAFRSHKSYAGMAVHHYDSYRLRFVNPRD